MSGAGIDCDNMETSDKVIKTLMVPPSYAELFNNKK